jgi:ABC-type cobalt transport system substrate-binding protein
MEKMDKDKENEFVQMIMRQTDYTEVVAREKLIENNYNSILVIKKYMGLDDKPKETIKSVNQEIYKQLRHKLHNPNASNIEN